jgi:hypothetical protein
MQADVKNDHPTSEKVIDKLTGEAETIKPRLLHLAQACANCL